MLGENGTGKTTFVKILAGKDKEKLAEVINIFKQRRSPKSMSVINPR